jgi:hypothetical protein
LYPPTSSSFRFLNSGLFVGRVTALRECMNDCVNEFITDINDQLWWTEKFLERQDIIELDYENKLFLNCVWLHDYEVIINGDKVTTPFNSNDPQLIHGNGPSKKLIFPLLDYARKTYNIDLNTPHQWWNY